MASLDLVDSTVKSLASRIGISDDDATILLVKFKWEDDFIVEKWSTDNDLIIRSGIMYPSRFQSLEEEVSCAQCQSPSVCKTFGCSHFFCNRCTKGYVEEKIRDGEFNIKCPMFQCDKMMASSRFLVDISADHKDLFRDGLVRSYNSSKSRKDMVNASSGYAAFHYGLGLVTGFVVRIWSNKWRALSTLLLLFICCRLFYGCTRATLQCVAELSLVYILAMNVLMGNILKVVFLYLLLKIVLNNHVLAAVVLSSVATSVLIFTFIAKAIRCCVAVVARR